MRTFAADDENLSLSSTIISRVLLVNYVYIYVYLPMIIVFHGQIHARLKVYVCCLLFRILKIFPEPSRRSVNASEM